MYIINVDNIFLMSGNLSLYLVGRIIYVYHYIWLKNIRKMKIQQGDIIGEKYIIIKKIGAGSFGTIYLGK